MTAIGEICAVIGGGTPSKGNAAFYEGDIPWASIRDMQGDWIEDTEFCITPAAVKASATNIIPAGNVIIATRVGLGKVARVRHDTAINQDIRAVIPRDENSLDKQYLFYWFKSIADAIEAEGKGATVKGVTLPFIKALKIPVPPLSEQAASSPSSTKPSNPSLLLRPTRSGTCKTRERCLRAHCT